MISEIEYTPTYGNTGVVIDDKRFLLSMDNKVLIYITANKAQRLNDYLNIIASIDETAGGTLSLDSLVEGVYPYKPGTTTTTTKSTKKTTTKSTTTAKGTTTTKKASKDGTTAKGFKIEYRDGAYYIGGILVANKSYPLDKGYIPKGTHLVLNVDDPFVNRLRINHKGPITTYGMDKNNYSYKSTINNIDAAYCPLCNQKLEYDFYHYGHLGAYHCNKYHFNRGTPNFEAKNVDVDNKY